MKAVQKPTTLALSATPTHPKDASVRVDIVTKMAVRSVASVIQHMTANRRSGKSLDQEQMSTIAV